MDECTSACDPANELHLLLGKEDLQPGTYVTSHDHHDDDYYCDDDDDDDDCDDDDVNGKDDEVDNEDADDDIATAGACEDEGKID